MKKKQLLLLVAASILAFSCGKDSNTIQVPTPSFAKGADVSWLSEMESDGKTFQTKNGTKADLFKVLDECGINAIRLRVWVNPAGGWSAKDDAVGLAERAAKAGMAVMIDFHYSDFFADPSRQTVPSDWASDKGSLDKMSGRVASHTKEVLSALKDRGVSPAWIQIGNETRNGMLWPLGQLWGDGAGGWSNFGALYKAGYEAAKAVFPSAKVMPHLPNAYDDNAWWFTELKKYAAFDMIALSHYPQTVAAMSPQQCNTAAANRIKALYSAFGVPVMISEVGVKTPADETAAAAVMKDFMGKIKALPSSVCAGVFYWEPEVYDWWKPAVYTSMGWNAYDMGAFLWGGKPSSVMDVFAD